MALRKHGTLVAATPATVTLTSPATVSQAYTDNDGNAATRSFQTARINMVEVVNVDGAAAIYFTVNGNVPVVGADDTFVIPAAIAAREVPVPLDDTAVVKLISAGTPAYAVSVA